MKKTAITVLFFLLLIGAKAQIGAPDLGDPNAVKRPDTTKPSITKIYNTLDIDKFPEFPGGINAYNKFLSHNLKWPKGEEENFGRVFISFVVERDGQLSDFKIEKGLSDSLDAEAIRVLKSSPKWKPGTLNGYKIRVKYVVPVNFILNK